MHEKVQDDPTEVATLATVEFVTSNVPGAKTILEVGCGAGQVAAALAKRGFAVTGVESDPSSVAKALESGVNVVKGSWPDVSVGRVNAVVFTRSLHHISPLPAAIAKTREVLLPQGLVLVEDFAFDAANKNTIEWFLTVLESPRAQSLIAWSEDSFVTRLHNAKNPLVAWHADHDHNLHTISDMRRELNGWFNVRDTHHVPYLYRYLIPVLPATQEAWTLVKETYDEEWRLGKRKEMSLIGRRITATSD